MCVLNAFTLGILSCTWSPVSSQAFCGGPFHCYLAHEVWFPQTKKRKTNSKSSKSSLNSVKHKASSPIPMHRVFYTASTLGSPQPSPSVQQMVGSPSHKSAHWFDSICTLPLLENQIGSGFVTSVSKGIEKQGLGLDSRMRHCHRYGPD